jgi:plasmid stabilization system protein ParE
MQIIYEPRFINSFNSIWDYIAEDSKSRANKFKKDIKGLIEDIPLMPYKYRKSIYFENENIRDLIFKGYTVVYKIEKETIIIIGIKKYKNEL